MNRHPHGEIRGPITVHLRKMPTDRSAPCSLAFMQHRNLARVAFYGTLTIALTILVTKAQALVLPAGLSSQIGHNSEALCFALLVCLSIEFVRPWGQRIGRPWAVAFGGAVLMWAGAWLLLQTDWSSSIVTLNEAMIGAGFLLIYVTIPRPFRLWPLALAGIAAFIVVFFDTSFVLDQAESLVPLLLAPIALDLVDRTILDPEQPDRPIRRTIWIATLFVIGFGFMALAPSARENLDSSLNLAIDYGQRAAEAYWGWILIHAYLGYIIGKTRPRVRSAATASR